MPTIDHVRQIAMALPGAEERDGAGGVVWEIRRKPFAWECAPWPSVPEEIRDIIGRETVLGVKVGDALEARALREMEPKVFLPQTTKWGEPKIAFRLARIAPDHLAELITESWRVIAPRYLRREFDGDES